jgi:hypothetical protein
VLHEHLDPVEVVEQAQVLDAVEHDHRVLLPHQETADAVDDPVQLVRRDVINAVPFAQPDGLYGPGQTVRVHGQIEWYQGDPVIYVHTPDQIEITGEASLPRSKQMAQTKPPHTGLAALVMNLTRLPFMGP